MYYPEEIVEEVRSRNNIVDLIGSYVKLTKRGGSYVGLCPFHNERTPSFHVSADKQMYYCFGCGEGGNIFTFLMKYENQSFPEAIRTLADRAGVTLPEEELNAQQKKERSKRQQLLEVNKEAAKFFVYCLRGTEGRQAMDYLKKRKLTDETISHFGLGYAPKNSRSVYAYLKKKGYKDDLLKDSGLFSYDDKHGFSCKFWNRVMFPIMNSANKVIGFGGRVMGDAKPKYLNSPETILFDKSSNLYGLNYARTSRKPYLILCEGYMDVIAMHQAGFTNAVASLGTAMTSKHAVQIRRYVNEVRLAYDSDEAGVKAALRAISILNAAQIHSRVIHMKPHKDPDEFIKAQGTDAFQKRIDDAESSFMFEVSVRYHAYRQDDPDERAAFIRETAGMLLRFPEEAERKVYIEAISRSYGIDSGSLTSMVNSLGARLSPQQIEQLSGSREESILPVQENRLKKPELSLLKLQRLILTLLSEDPKLLERTKGVLGADDFEDPLCRKIAEEMFSASSESGGFSPARILDNFEDAEVQKSAAAVFHEKLAESFSEEEIEKSLTEAIIRVKQNMLDKLIRNAKSTEDMQRIIRLKKELENFTLPGRP